MTLIQQPAAVSIDTILLATDFSGASEKATSYAKAVARQFGATLEMIHVADPSAVSVYDEAIVGTPIEEKLRKDLSNLHLDQVSYMESGVVTKSFTTEGHDAAQTLLNFAHAHKSDLIVAGTQAKKGVERLVLGSTAEKLIRNAECPVLTVGPNASWPAEGLGGFRCIVYATDFSTQSAKAARYALAFAAHNGSRLCCCHVENSEMEVPAIRDENMTIFSEALRHIMPENAVEGCKPEFFVERGEPAQGILSLAENVGADLIVLAPRKSSFWLKYVDHGLTPNLIAEAKCPVMTIC
jgi:nucleotide-binding universal stress UspA family protein